jgi:short-subunit dehydrogenase
MRDRASNKTALVTDATSGIGLELSKILATSDYKLVLVARDEQRLRRFAADLPKNRDFSTEVFATDLSVPGTAEKVYNQLRQRGIKIDLLVNNAGFGLTSAFMETDLRRELELIQLNIVSLVVLTKFVVREMLQRKQGRILNVASTAAFQPGPFMAIYYASKAFVLSFTEGLAEELKDTGLTITTLCPGPTATEFSTSAGVQKSKLFASGVVPVMNAKTVAEIAYRGLIEGRRVVIPGLMNRIGVQALRLSPRRLVTQLVKFLNT